MTVTVLVGDKRLYEIMVLYDPSDVTKEWDALVESLTERITKLEGSVVKVEQWAENKKLAYEVKGLRRGSYLTAYFHLDPSQVETLERNLRLDERIVRHVVVVHHRLPPEFAPKEEKKEEKTDDKPADEKASDDKPAAEGAADEKAEKTEKSAE